MTHTERPPLVFGEPLGDEDRVCVLRCKELGTFEIRPGESATLGRAPGNTILARGVGVSRVHARICWDEGDLAPVLTDNDSANGTLLDGRPVQDDRLPRQCRIEMGPFEFDVHVRGWGDSALLDEAEHNNSVGLFSEWQTLSGKILDAFSLHEVLRKLESVKATGTLHVEIPDGAASITLGLGRIMAAKTANALDLKALDVILDARRGTFSFGRELEPCESVLDLSFTEYDRAQRKSQRGSLTERLHRQPEHPVEDTANTALKGAEPGPVEPRTPNQPMAWLSCPPFDAQPLGLTPEYVIGREASCDLVLPHVSVCSVHAVIYVKDGDLIVEDRSLYGTTLNGARIMISALRPEDLLVVGPYELKVEDVAPRATKIQTQPLRKFVKSKTKGGRLERVSLAEIVRHLEAHGATGELKVTHKAAQLSGVVCLAQGRIVHAELGPRADKEALEELFRLDRGRFEFHAKKKIKLKTMNASTTDLA